MFIALSWMRMPSVINSFSSDTSGRRYSSTFSGFLSPQKIATGIGATVGNSAMLIRIGQNCILLLLVSGRPSTETYKLIVLMLRFMALKVRMKTV